MKIGSDRKECKISDVEITNDTLSGRGGLSLLLRYIDNTGIYSLIEEKFGHLRQSSKGVSIGECARQFMAFGMDGTNHSIARFDELKRDPGYAAVQERNIGELLSTASMKRFFSKFNGTTYASFRSLLNELFIWRFEARETGSNNIAS